MRFSKIIWKISPALLGMAALILIAGAAAGQGNDFFNDAAGIDPDEKYAGTTGGVDGVGSEYESWGQAMCEDAQVDYTIGCVSWHPDRVNLSTHQGQVDQKKRDNNAIAWISVNKFGGEVIETFDSDLECDKVQLKGKLNTKKPQIDVKCTIKKCALPGIITVDFINDAIACAEEAQDSGALGKRAGNLKLRNIDELSGDIRSKGTPLMINP
jgi:hypothetical protein